jgi:two-component system, sensor histidine kinase LadS
MVRMLLFALFGLFSFGAKGQSVSVNERTENLSLETIAKVYKDTENKLQIQQILTLDSTKFSPISHLNIGITYSNYWLKFSLKNTINNEIDLFLAFESIVNDSLFLYKVAQNRVASRVVLGENMPFSAKRIKHQTPIFNIQLQPNEQAQFYIKSSGNGQPMNLTAKLLNAQGFHDWDVRKTFFLGIIYGIMFLILILNFSFFLITKENIYIVFSGQVAFSALCIAYFDGFIYQYVFPNSGYWSNQTIAIAMCFTFIFNNRFTSDFFNLKNLVSWAYHTFRYATVLIISILAFSFLHPLGFNTFVVLMTALTSLVALLLFVSILFAKRQGFTSYFFSLVATLCLIVFGLFFQLFLIGIVSGNFFTHYTMHLAVVTQSVFLALAVNDKFRIIREENAYYQVKLVETLNQYSQNLISNIEAERQRLAIDIHDGFGQNLLAMRNITLKALKQKKLSAKIEDTLQTLLETTTETLDDARAIAYNLRPPILNTMGLTVAIQTLVEKIRTSSSLKIQFKIEQSLDGLVAKENEINVYRILQESFNNVLKHAKATKIDLEILRKNELLEIIFKDNGIGYNQDEIATGQGILGMKERVALLKGSIVTESNSKKGTNIFIKIPIK